MSATRTSRVGQIAGRVKEIWAELDYAQARLLEIRTGVPGLTRRDRTRSARRVRASSSHPQPVR
ncbi:MAG: hypothetical protein ABI355_02150 [Solirubrobacteraceae bacterium]